MVLDLQAASGQELTSNVHAILAWGRFSMIGPTKCGTLGEGPSVTNAHTSELNSAALALAPLNQQG